MEVTEIDYIIVQAGGRGSRMQYLTENKPKCLVPVHNKPMLFHLFDKYPLKKFIIIGDYKCNILKRYLDIFASVDYEFINASRYKGTCAGLKEAMMSIPDHKAFMLIWSDLVLSDTYSIPQENGNYIGLSGGFPCRWRYKNGVFEENPSVSHGVAGLFLSADKEIMEDVPENGEFVKWLKKKLLFFTAKYQKDKRIWSFSRI